jgi:hypothetical protein
MRQFARLVIPLVIFSAATLAGGAAQAADLPPVA